MQARNIWISPLDISTVTMSVNIKKEVLFGLIHGDAVYL